MNYEDFEDAAAMEAEHYDNNLNITTSYHDEHEQKIDNCWNRFSKAVRGCWATKHTEDTVHDRELYIKTTVRELLVYIIFLIILMAISFGMTSGLNYYYTNILNNLFTQTNFQDGSGQYATALAIGDYWKFLNGPVMGGLYWNQWYNNVPVVPSQINFIFYENKLIGIPRLRQVRVTNSSCTIPSEFKSSISRCYGPYSSSNEFTGSYGLANSSAWIYSNESSLNGRSSTGTIATYGGGGFYVDLNQTSLDSSNTVNFLYNNLWIDRGTRAVILDFTVYNANINLFCVIKFVTDFSPTGGIIPNYEFRTVKLIRYVTTSDYCIMACEIIFLFFIIYYGIEEILEIRKHRFLYFTSIWNWMDIIVIVFSVVGSAFNVYRTLAVQNFLTQLLANQQVYPNFDFLSYWQLQFNYAIAFTLFVAWVKIFKYISFNKTMTQLSLTLSKCSKDLMCFGVMFFIVFLSFAQLGYLVFGSQCPDFRKFEISIYTLFRIILGDFDFNQIQSANRILGPMFFVLYIFFVFFVLFNMFLAIINESYGEVKEELAAEENEFEMADFFKQRANLLLGKLNLKRDKILDIQSALMAADSNNDNRLDFDEWKAELKIRGYADEEIEAVFAKYDTDGDRVLDEEERKNMQSELEGQKMALTNEIESKIEYGDETSKQSVSIEEYHVLAVRVDHMETTVSSIVTKIDSVLQNLVNMEKTKSKNREAMGLILNTLASDDYLSDEERRIKLEALVNEEIVKMNKESLVSVRPKSGNVRTSNFMGRE